MVLHFSLSGMKTFLSKYFIINPLSVSLSLEKKKNCQSCSLSVLADLCLKAQEIQRAFAAPLSRSAEGFNEIGNNEVVSTCKWQTSLCVFLSRSYTVLNPCFLMPV